MATKKSAKKSMVSQIADKLLTTFGELKNAGESRKVKRSVRKASKALAAGLEAAKKKQGVKKIKSIAAEGKNGKHKNKKAKVAETPQQQIIEAQQ